MQDIVLNNGMIVKVDDEDFIYLNERKWQVHYSKSGIYATANIKGKTIRMHRLILNVTDPKIFVDHKDRNTLNNCRQNLRTCTISQSNANTGKRKNCLSKYKGVSFDKQSNKWRVNIGRKNIRINGNEKEAALKYNELAIERYGEFAVLNAVE